VRNRRTTRVRLAPFQTFFAVSVIAGCGSYRTPDQSRLGGTNNFRIGGKSATSGQPATCVPVAARLAQPTTYTSPSPPFRTFDSVVTSLRPSSPRALTGLLRRCQHDDVGGGAGLPYPVVELHREQAQPTGRMRGLIPHHGPLQSGSAAKLDSRTRRQSRRRGPASHRYTRTSGSSDTDHP
jgi:hypothetical protein